MLPDPLPIDPVDTPLDVVVTLPGSKSITNRALVCAALAGGTSTLTNALHADDTEAMVDGLQALGARIEAAWSDGRITVTGTAGEPSGDVAIIDARLSGTTSRFLLPLAGLGVGLRRVDAANRMRERPMGEVLDAVRALGASVHEVGAPGQLPVEVEGGTLAGGEVTVRGDVSSQFLSGLLLSAPAMPAGLVVHVAGDLVSEPYVDLTVEVMGRFGVTVERPDPRTWVVVPQPYVAIECAVEPDASAASYVFAAAAVVGGRVTVPDLGTSALQGDLAFVDLLEQMGARVERGPTSTTVAGAGTLHGIDADMSQISDTAPTLAVVAAFADSPSRVTGIGFIRGKETDRIGAVVAELQRLGVDASEEPDGFTVRPGPIRPATVQTYDDHRMAMAFAVAGLQRARHPDRGPGLRGQDLPRLLAAARRAAGHQHRRHYGPPLVRIIAIDGPAGSGKSTVAKALAARLGLDYLDTGAMYRSVTFSALRRGIDPSDADVVGRIVGDIEIRVDPEGVVVDGVDASIEIRGPEVSRAVSVVASNPLVRAEMVQRQRAWVAERDGGVLEGRDIGTVVFPDAELKVYLTADPEVRAERRSKEVSDLDYETVAADLARRDALDQGREVSPLTEAPDAFIVDTTGQSVEEIVDAIAGRLGHGRIDG